MWAGVGVGVGGWLLGVGVRGASGYRKATEHRTSCNEPCRIHLEKRGGTGHSKESGRIKWWQFNKKSFNTRARAGTHIPEEQRTKPCIEK